MRRFLWRLLLGAAAGEIAGELLFPVEIPEQQMGWWLSFMTGAGVGCLLAVQDAVFNHLERRVMASQMDEIS